jgi:small-conductance mechanosensitive channel
MFQVTEPAAGPQGAAEGVVKSLEGGKKPDDAVDSLSDLISDQVSNIVENPFAGAVLILIAAILLGKVVDGLLRATLSVWVKRSDTPLDDLALQHLSGPIVKTTVLYGFWVSAVHLELDDTSARLFVSRVIQTLLVMIWSFGVLSLVSAFLRHASTKRDKYKLIEGRTFPLFSNLTKVALVGVAIYGVILVWGVNTSAWLASAGIATFAISFAAQDTLSNLFAGVFIIADAPYRIGDYIVLDSASGGTRGEVTSIGLRSTRVVTRDDIEITIPNAVIGGAQIINQTAGPSPKMRLRVPVGVAYDTDVDRLRAILLEVAEADPLVCEDPEPRVRFRAFGPSSLDFQLLVWVKDPEDRGKAMDTLLEAVLVRLRAEGVEIPYPKQDLYLKEQPSS